jgi:hypothetical protein
MLRSLLDLLRVLSLSAPVLELRMRRLGASALGVCQWWLQARGVVISFMLHR